jgi:phosphinothricin acetyltransferase
VLVSSTAIWRDQPVDLDDRRAWFEQRRRDGFPVLVATRDGRVLGWASYGGFRVGSGYDLTVENSVHVGSAHRGQGIGQALMRSLIARAREAGLHMIVAGVDADTQGSIRFHERLGFRVVGRMPEVGRKQGRWLDLVLMQLAL